MGRSAASATATPNRMAPYDDALRAVARSRERVGRVGIKMQAPFRRLSGRTSIAAIGQCQEAGAVGHQPTESLRLPGNDLGIAVEIENDRLIVLRDDMPGDQPRAIHSLEQDLLGLGQTRIGGRNSRRIGMIEQRALAETQAGDKDAIAGGRDHEKPFQFRDHRRHSTIEPEPYSALTISSVIFLPSPNSIMVLSRKNSSFSTPA